VVKLGRDALQNGPRPAGCCAAWALGIEFVPKRMRATVVTIIMVSQRSAMASRSRTRSHRHGWQGVYLGAGSARSSAVALWIWLPESIRLTLSGRRPDVVARTLHRLDPVRRTANDRFVLSDESDDR
jgi:AAHS family 4-hydroxybenzoate transporter-like MFS transporter